MDQNSIIITPVANGFIVQLPRQEQPIQLPDMTNMAEMIRSVIGKDPIMDSLKKQSQDETEKLLKSIQPPLNKDNGTYIFMNFKQVLTFLKDEFKHI